VLRYALALPEGALLSFTPRLHAAARASAASALVKVTLQAEGGEERELWRGQVGISSQDKEVAVELPGNPGDVVRLGLHVSGAGSDRFAWVVWKGPRVLGRARPGLDALAAGTAADAPEEEQKAQALREQVRGSNVVLVILDAARAESFGCYGYGRGTTPEVDRIAQDGIVFERAGTPAVYTLGAMSSLWTSQYPDRHHAEVSYADRLPASRLTLAQALGARGTHTAGFVANAMAGTAFGFDRGFSEFTEVFRLFPDLGSTAGSFARVLPRWLQQHRDRPFFAYVHFREPHFPYDPPAPFTTRFGPDAPLDAVQRRDKAWYTAVNQGQVKPSEEEIAHLRRLYDGNLAFVDQQVGELRKALEAAGLWDKTVLIVAADHGEQLYEHGYVSHSAQVHEQSTHVPLIVRFPAGRGPRGERRAQLVDLLDVAPTVLEILRGPAGVPGPQPPAGGGGGAREGGPALAHGLGAPGLRAARRALQAHVRHAHRRGEALRPAGRPGRGARHRRAAAGAGRLVPADAAAVAVTDGGGLGPGGGQRGSRGAHAGAVREPELARLHDGGMPRPAEALAAAGDFVQGPEDPEAALAADLHHQVGAP